MGNASQMSDTAFTMSTSMKTDYDNKCPKHKNSTCNYCKKKGHLKIDCWKNPKSKKYRKPNVQANIVKDESDEDHEDVLAVWSRDSGFRGSRFYNRFNPENRLGPKVQQKSVSSKFYADSGGSYHICANFDWFSDYN